MSETLRPQGQATRGARHKIYCFNNGGSPGWYTAMAIGDDGHHLASHMCSSEGFMAHDLGITSNWKHENYNQHFGEGNWELEWVPDPSPGKHPGLDEAYRLNQLLEAQPVSSGETSTVRSVAGEAQKIHACDLCGNFHDPAYSDCATGEPILPSSVQPDATAKLREEVLCYGDRVNELNAEIANLRAQLAAALAPVRDKDETLRGIAEANWREWGDGFNTLADFAKWAKSRANHALAKQPDASALEEKK